ncbi:hypothetical protein HDU96_000622 [Phlyctochytrium bullatum]|nr:hypothetical protein HDU96_000622 [Phlyctochytrium bullatum]
MHGGVTKNMLSQLDKTLFSTDDPDFIAFQFGAPGPDLLPLKAIEDSFHAFLKSDDPHSYLQYGPQLGHLGFRQALAEFLTAEYQDPVSPDRLCVTNGASQSFSNILTLFTDKDTQIIIENPTYFLAIRVLEDHGIPKESLWKVTVDEDGVDLTVLKKLLDSKPKPAPRKPHNGVKRYSYLLYLVPTYSNPTGFTLSRERREALIAIAREYDILVVCDDVYTLLPFGSNQPPPRLYHFDKDTAFGNVISNQSFSKVLCPGVRLGWIEAGPGIIDQYLKSGLMYSGGCPNHFFSGMAESALRTGLMKTHLEHLKALYGARMNAMCDYLDANLPRQVGFKRPKGGFFIWLVLPDSIDTSQLAGALRDGGTVNGKAIAKAKMSYAPGNSFSVDTSHRMCLRLSFAYYDEQHLLLGLERLVNTLKVLFE